MRSKRAGGPNAPATQEPNKKGASPQTNMLLVTQPGPGRVLVTAHGGYSKWPPLHPAPTPCSHPGRETGVAGRASLF